MNQKQNKRDTVKKTVREAYGKIARSGGGCCGAGCECGGTARTANDMARGIGYAEEELSALPEGANMGLSCGNPTALATLQPGEAVLDLGSGGGFDVFIAGQKVGAAGRAIGVDMTPEMVSKARANTGVYRKRTGLDNVEFRLGEIEHLPVPDESVDVVISNCVINLSDDKAQVWREIARVLRPGGRVAVSDIALLKPLPKKIAEMVEALVGCVAGAAMASDTKRMMKEAGLTEVALTPKREYMEALAPSQDPLYRKILAAMPKGTRPSDYATSMYISARKPGGRAGARSGRSRGRIGR